jgi:uncharacterized membrane protein YdcZ (DUF606 family)
MSRQDVIKHTGTVLLGVAGTVLVALLLDRIGWNNPVTKVLTIGPTAVALFIAERQIKHQSGRGGRS